MMILLGLIAAASSVMSGNGEMIVPISYPVVQSADVRVPISDAVRAATWDDLAMELEQPVDVRLACIVFVPSGAPGNCVPASLIPPGQKTVDWSRILDVGKETGRSASPMDTALFEIASRRVRAIRVGPGGRKPLFAIRFFEELVSPADARAPLAQTDEVDLTTLDVVFAEPLDAKLLQLLYPSIAMRYSVNAQVRAICRIEPDLKLLCRHAEVLALEPADVAGYTEQLIEDLRFSTYQLASTIKLEPKSVDGRDIAGRNFRFVVRWSTPQQ